MRERSRRRAGGGVVFQQRFADGLDDDVADRAVIMEFHFALGGMNVDVNGCWVHFEEEATDRVAAFHKGGVIALEQCEIQRAVFNRSAIDEKVLVFASGTGNARFSDEPPDAEGRRHLLSLALSSTG